MERCQICHPLQTWVFFRKLNYNFTLRLEIVFPPNAQLKCLKCFFFIPKCSLFQMLLKANKHKSQNEIDLFFRNFVTEISRTLCIKNC